MTHRLLLISLCASAAACSSEPATAPHADPGVMVAPGTVQVIIAQEANHGGDTSVFAVRIVANGVPLAAYQGRLTFVPSGMDVMGVLMPENGDGEFRIANTTGASSGTIRFAGFAMEGMSSTVAFRLLTRLHGNVAALKLEGAVDIAGEASGSPIAASALRRSTGVYDGVTSAQLTP